MKTIYQTGFRLRHLDDAAMMSRIYAAATKCGGVLGLDGHSMITSQIEQVNTGYGGKFTLNLSPYHDDMNAWGEHEEQMALLERCLLFDLLGDRIENIFLDCERWKLDDDGVEQEELTRLYDEAYDIVRAVFPGVPIVWFSDLDSPHGLLGARSNGHSLRVYWLYDAHATIKGTIGTLRAAPTDVGGPITAFVAWYKGDDFGPIDPIHAWWAGAMLAIDRGGSAFERVTNVCLNPGLYDDRLGPPEHYDRMLDAFLLGMNKQPWEASTP